MPTIYITQIRCWCTEGLRITFIETIILGGNEDTEMHAINSNNHLPARVFPSTMLPQMAPKLCIWLICLHINQKIVLLQVNYIYKGTLRRSHDINIMIFLNIFHQMFLLLTHKQSERSFVRFFVLPLEVLFYDATRFSVI